jgi:starch-binding outer membrane protein, SusD/RagB family
MNIKRYFIAVLVWISLGLFINNCEGDFLNVNPEHVITPAIFPENEADMQLLLNGVYANLRETSLYNQGLFAFGTLDGATPNAYNWGNTPIARAGNGSLSSTDGQFLTFAWTRAYSIINRANTFLNTVENADFEMTEDARRQFLGEAHFLRGLAYSRLVELYGGVPIITDEITTEEARELTRATAEETWNQVISDYNIAIEALAVEAAQPGKATKGAALGMKMRAHLYQGNYHEVLNLVDEIDALGKYALFPSYEGLFMLQNQNNEEVLFDIQYLRGENDQGSSHDQFCGTGTGTHTRGTRYVPTDDLVSAYEMIDGSEVPEQRWISPDDPWELRDPRLDFTILRPGAYYLGDYRFPNYIYEGGAYTHPGNDIKHLASRKYFIEPPEDPPPAHQSDLNYIVLRYADVILSKAEAIIETNGNIDEAVQLINHIRTERDDVTITELPMGMSQEEARERLRHERRIEFALEGLYFADIRRWNIGDEIYPVEVRNHTGGLTDVKFPSGYSDHFNLLPIPDREISLNPNLTQNPGW